MKTLIHRTPAAGMPFVLSDLKWHLRVDHSDDDTAITNIGCTAAAELEDFAQIALLTQTIRVTVFAPEVSVGGFTLPIGPVIDSDTVTVSLDGADFTGFEFVPGKRRPYLRWLDSYYDAAPERLAIEYQAGFGADASAIPIDLAQAIMDQAALYYDGRSPMDRKALTTSPHMARIGARYRGVQA
ncbi:hypothetical protein RGUI_0193 [Rhodovulum sp. P5]|uniref:head-tail connector protein n=1 Tax=Rhodovulum sp. P5 TaxID=1564506 RepID=UPI0009C2830C|nr:phage head-tail connector protein [Rhodovulum sp. P5]ARE38334.1 hypothetical protein RGUI_0193 [Rhodovulum sp. P5]